jgi:hypothetical protein
MKKIKPIIKFKTFVNIEIHNNNDNNNFDSIIPESESVSTQNVSSHFMHVITPSSKKV